MEDSDDSENLSQPVRALNMELPQQQMFIRTYHNLPAKADSTIRFFSHGDFYSAHHPDCKYLVEDLCLSAELKTMGESPRLTYISLSRHAFERAVRELLLVRQHRVEVYVRAAKGECHWSLEYKGSPGNLGQFEEILYDGAVGEEVCSSAVMGVRLSGKGNMLISVGCINTTESEIHLAEFSDNEFFTELEGLIAQVSPKECIIPSGATDAATLQRLRSIVTRNGILVTSAAVGGKQQDDVEGALNRLLYFSEGQTRRYQVYPELNSTESVNALYSIIKYLNLTADERNFNQYKLFPLELRRYVRLDNAAVSALNLFPPTTTSHSAFSHSTSHNHHSSIHSLLSHHCVTAQGRRLLDHWLRQPLRDLRQIAERQEVVEVLVARTETRTVLHTVCLPRLPDLTALSKRLAGKRAGLFDCWRVYQSVESVLAMMQVLLDASEDCEAIKVVLVEPLAELMMDLEKYQSMIEQTLDMTKVDEDIYIVKPSIDKDLEEVYENMTATSHEMSACARDVARRLDVEDHVIALGSNDHLGHYYRVTLANEQTLRDHVGHYTVLDTVKGGVRFTDDALSELSKSYQELHATYQDKQKGVVKEVLDIACGYADTLRNLNYLIAKTDVLLSFALAAVNAKLPYVKPTLLPLGSGVLNLKGVRHPCLENQDISVIPNDANFNSKEYTTFIITGPNMGGKSTFMRSVGVTVLLAHIGSLVPCESAEISLVDCILARIGAQDCERKGMSTFMMEMVECCGIVRSATSNSLVLIDELGRGTSTLDGLSIATSVLEYLAKEAKCFTLFATHFNEITHLSETIPAVCNVHVTVLTDDGGITPLFKVQSGACGESYGIHCARVGEYPEEVLQAAAKYQKELESENGLKYLKNIDFIKRETIIKEGDAMIKSFIEDLLKNDTDNMTDEELDKLFDTTKHQLLDSDNLFLKGLLEHKREDTLFSNTPTVINTFIEEEIIT